MQIKVQFTEEYRQQQFINEGVLPNKEEVIEVDPVDLNAETRQALVNYKMHLRDVLDLTTLAKGYSPISFEVPAADLTPEEMILKFIAAKDDLRHKNEQEHQARVDAANEELQATIQRHRERLEANASQLLDNGRSAIRIPDHASDDLKREATELNARIQRVKGERRAERERKEKEEFERFHTEKLEWVREHGSDHLKESCEAGYNCKRLYVYERAALEYSEYTVDFDDRADWSPRACPNASALAEAKRVGGTVVWLNNPPYEIDEEYYDRYDMPWEETEAVVIEGYLPHKRKSSSGGYYPHSYTLIREM